MEQTIKANNAKCGVDYVSNQTLNLACSSGLGPNRNHLEPTNYIEDSNEIQPQLPTISNPQFVSKNFETNLDNFEEKPILEKFKFTNTKSCIKIFFDNQIYN
jgi:hypothetical protein